MINQKIKELLKRVTTTNKEEIDNEITEIQVSEIKKSTSRYSTDMQEYLENEKKEIKAEAVMRPIKKDIERYGFVYGRRLA